MTEFVKADSSLRVRRAFLRNHSMLSVQLAGGQRRFFWRDARAGRLRNVRWIRRATVDIQEPTQMASRRCAGMVLGSLQTFSCET